MVCGNETVNMRAPNRRGWCLHWCVVTLLELYSPRESSGGLCDARRGFRRSGGRRPWLVPNLVYKIRESGLGLYHTNEDVATGKDGRG